MFEGFAILALSFAIAALAVAIASDVRTRRATREIARELVALRDRLLRAEREGGFDPDLTSSERSADASVAAMSERVEELEARLRELIDRRGAEAAVVDVPETPAAPDVAVVRALGRAGYRRVAVLEVHDDGRVLVEAEREGTLVKGMARLADDGGVQMVSVSSLRAFP